MPRLGEFGRRLWMLARRTQRDRDLDDEMRLHMELLEQRERSEGTPEGEARARVRRQFGNPVRIIEDCRDAAGWRWVDDLASDIGYAARSLVRYKAFSVTAITTLALAIGANTAIFSVVSGVILRPLPFDHPDRLVQVYGTPPVRGEAVDRLDEYRRQSTSFDALVGYGVSARFLRLASHAERVMTVTAERGVFQMLGVPSFAGRTFIPDDPASVAVLSARFWNERLGGDLSVIGRSVTLDGVPFTILGIMPDSFQFPYGAASTLPGVAAQVPMDLWIPLDPPADTVLRARARFNSVTGRLKPDVSLAQAASELAIISGRLQAANPDPYGPRGVRIEPLSDAVVAKSVRRPLFVLLGAVGIVLMLACANVTNLSLVRTTIRRREIAVRAALGATPFRLVRQFLAESLLLSIIGGLFGLALAWWGTQALTTVAGTYLPRAHEVNVDRSVLLYSFAVCVVAAVLVGLAPALIAQGTNAQSVLQDSGGHSTMGLGPRRFRDGVMVAEVALAFALAVGAALLVRELLRLEHTDTGMATENVLTFHLGERPSWWGISRRGAPREADVRPFYEIENRVAQLPGVQAAGFTQVLPLQNWGWGANASDFTIRGRPPFQSAPSAIELRYVTPGYFQALGIPIKKGRGFTERDTGEAPPVIVVNETLVRRFFGYDDPVGNDTNRGTIVGVVGDVRQVNIDRAASAEIYYPVAQNYSQVLELGMSLVVKARTRPDLLVDPIRGVIRDVAPNEAIFNAKTMDEVVADSLSEFTLYSWLMTSFAALALVLALTGTYGVISSIATSRTREFAVRVALGADRARVTKLIFGQGLRFTTVGLACGLITAYAAAPLVRTMPVSVRPPDIVTIAPVALLIAAVAMVACVAPALRAARVDPMRVLRNE